MSLSFSIALLSARGVTHVTERHRRRLPALHSLLRRTFSAPRSDDVRVHHFLPGLVLLTAAGGGAILSRDDGRELLLSIPFGTGAGLALDEIGLLVERKNPYWGSEHLALGQAAAGGLVAVALGIRMVVIGRHRPRGR